MNGTYLTLGLVGALAAAGVLGRRGSRSSRCPSDALVFYHGAQRWEGPPTIVTHRKGHAEHGPGLYLTTNWETANRYAKGGGSVYRVSLLPEVRWAEDVKISADEARAFVRSLPRLRGREAILESLGRVEQRSGPRMRLQWLVNMFVNQGASAGQHGPSLAAFLTERGADASLISHSVDEDWVVVFNPQIVCNVRRLERGQTSRQGFAFDLPKVARRPS